jgi:alcohol dehydrogenase class IV
MPPQLTADTGLDCLSHAIEGYTCNLRNDFSDGLCLKAIELIFEFLPRAVKDGSDMEAREKVHNAATLAGLGFGNAMAALAHSLGHSLGATFETPHGRSVALFLPYTIQFIQREAIDHPRFDEISRFLGLPAGTPEEGAASLVKAIRELYIDLGQPLTLERALNIPYADFEKALDTLVELAETDSVITMGARIPTTAETRKLFEYAFEGKDIDF